MNARNVILLTTALAAVVFGAERFDHQVRNKFFAGFAGDTEALAEAMKICESVLAENPKHSEARVWYGSGQLSQAGQLMATDRQKGIQLYTEGLKNVDRAVEEAPDSVGVRAPRGAVVQAMSHYVPGDQKKSLLARTISDYERIVELQRPYWDKVGTHPKGEVLFGLGDAYSRTGDNEKAAMYFERVAKELPGTVYAKRAAKWLDTRTPLGVGETRCVGCHTGK
jgi:tetratricopeptide (TPR) repeat protein